MPPAVRALEDSASQQGAAAGDELAHAEGLGQVVVAADFKADHFVELGVAGRKEQHRGRGARAQTAAEFVAIHAGQHDVQDEQVVVALGGHGQGLFAVVGNIDAEPFLHQVVGDEVRNRLLVIDDQDAFGIIVHGSAFHLLCASRGIPSSAQLFVLLSYHASIRPWCPHPVWGREPFRSCNQPGACRMVRRQAKGAKTRCFWS